jgi:hypothetical protein
MWASAFPGIRAGLVSYSPYSLALLRYLVASAVLLIYALVTRMPLPALRDVPGIAAVGFLGFSAYNVALNAGQQGVTAGVASFIVASAPIYMAIMATVLYRERLTGFGWLGILVSFGGVALISGASGTGWQVNGWALLVLIAAVVQAMYHVLQKPSTAQLHRHPIRNLCHLGRDRLLADLHAGPIARSSDGDSIGNLGRSLYGCVSGGGRLCELVASHGAGSSISGRQLFVSGAIRRRADRLGLAR